MPADVDLGADIAELVVEARQQGPIPLDLAFSCRGGERVALFGPSGGGKTTVLRTIAGLYQPTFARVVLGGAVWTDTASGIRVPVHRRRCALMFQDYALFPHMTARQNIQAAMGDQSRDTRERRVAELLTLTELTDFAERRPEELSGGQRQRVALARAVARDPAVLLLDEPFSALDDETRVTIRSLVGELTARHGWITVLVSHHVDDVAALASRSYHIEDGRLAEDRAATAG